MRDPARESASGDVGLRIDVAAVLQHLEVHVRPGGAPGAAHQCDGFPSFDFVTPLFQQFVIVPVAGFHTMSMIYHNGQAQQTFLAGKGDNAVSGGQDRRPFARGNVKSFVQLTPTGKRRFAVSKSGGYPGFSIFG